MTILGIDPGLNATGFGVIDATAGQLTLQAAGAIKPRARQPLAQRLQMIYDGLAGLMKTYHPTVAVLEALYTHHQYLTTAALMAHARGMACVLSAQHHLSLVDYLPTRVKKAVTGRGSASKDQVARMVEQWLGIPQEQGWSSDATDALALAIAHAHISEHDPLAARVPGRRRARVLGSGMAMVMRRAAWASR